MTSLFVFALIVGGGLLAISLLGDLLGGGDADLDTDLDTDFDADFDTDVAVDADVAMDDIGTDAAGVEGEVSTDLAGAIRIFTIRNLTYFLFGFGGVGWLLVTTRPDLPIWVATVAAVVGGTVAAGAAAVIFGWVKATESGWQADETTYVGCEARVVLPVRHERMGRIIVRRGDREHELRALPFDARADGPERWRTVIVIEMDGGTARVSPLEALTPAEDEPGNP